MRMLLAHANVLIIGYTYRISSTNNGQVPLKRFRVNVRPYIPSRNMEGRFRPLRLGASVGGRVVLLVCDSLLEILDPNLQTPIALGSDQRV